MFRGFLRLTHTVDIQTKTTSTKPSGQKVGVWSVTTPNQRCFITPKGSTTSIRTSPTVEEADWLTMEVPYNTSINYNSRIVNIRHRISGEVLYDGPFEVKQIDKQIAFNGKVQYLIITLKSVIET